MTNEDAAKVHKYLIKWLSKIMLIILTNEETARVNKQLIKWLSEIKGVPYMLAPRRPWLDYSKIYSDKV